jgi:hypothetical protein
MPTTAGADGIRRLATQTVYLDDGIELTLTVSERLLSPAERARLNLPPGVPLIQLGVSTNPVSGPEPSDEAGPKKLKGKDWLAKEVDHRRAAGDLPNMISTFADQIFAAMKTADKAGVVRCFANAKVVETRLRDYQLWP